MLELTKSNEDYLEAIGLLNAGRAMEIIGAPVQPEERP